MYYDFYHIIFDTFLAKIELIIYFVIQQEAIYPNNNKNQKKSNVNMNLRKKVSNKKILFV